MCIITNNETYIEYLKYIDSHVEEISSQVNTAFLQKKEKIREDIISLIVSVFGDDKSVPHYEWQRGDVPWDYSGELYKAGKINLNQTIAEFLDDEYTGNWIPTFQSGHGMRFATYEDSLSEETLNIGCSIMLDVIQHCVENEFHITFTPDEFEDFRIEGDFDSVYDNCLANEFFSALGAVRYVGLENVTLKDLLDEQGNASSNAKA